MEGKAVRERLLPRAAADVTRPGEVVVATWAVLRGEDRRLRDEHLIGVAVRPEDVAVDRPGAVVAPLHLGVEVVAVIPVPLAAPAASQAGLGSGRAP